MDPLLNDHLFPGVQPPRRELTPRQCTVAALLTLADKQIAHELGLSENTIAMYISTICMRTGLANRTQIAVAFALGRLA
jgi:DNA-binding NarL/FixJ family response regulator